MINDFAGLNFCFTKLAVLIDSEMSNNYLVTTSETQALNGQQDMKVMAQLFCKCFCCDFQRIAMQCQLHLQLVLCWLPSSTSPDTNTLYPSFPVVPRGLG